MSIINSTDLMQLKKSFIYIKKYRKSIILLNIITIIILISELIQPFIFGNIIDLVINKEIGSIIINFILFIFLSLLCAILIYFENILLAKINNNIERDVRNDIIKNYLNLDYVQFINNKRGIFIEKIEQDSKVFSQLILQCINGITSDIFTVIFLGFIIIKINYKLSLLLILVYPINLFINRLFGKLQRRKNLEYKTLKDEYLSLLNEIILGFKIIKIYNANNKIQNKHNDFMNKITNKKIEAAYIYSKCEIVIKITNIAGYLLMIGFGIFEIINGNMTLGMLIAFNSYATNFNTSLFSIAKINAKIQESLVSINRIFSEFTSCQSNSIGKLASTNNLSNDIYVKNLCFSYEDKEVLKNINIKLYSNQINAIVGASGSGKSTLLDILLGIYDNNKYVKTGNIKKGNIQKKVILVNQEEILFSGTIKENLLIGVENFDDNSVIDACKKVNLHDFISSLSEKYNTYIGEGGVKLSTGQKQRLVIARAIIAGADIFLFDEITSALDAESEKSIIDLLIQLKEISTVILVSHKTNTILCSDYITVLDNGLIECTDSKSNVIKNSNIIHNILA